MNKINAIIELKNNIRDAEREFDNNRKLCEELKVIHNRLILLSKEANSRLKNLLQNCNSTDLDNYKILQEYKEWITSRITPIVSHLVSIINASKLSVLQNATCSNVSINDFLKSGNCLYSHCAADSLSYERKKSTHIEEQIDDYTKNSIDKIDRQVMRYIDITEDYLRYLSEKINQIEHEIYRLSQEFKSNNELESCECSPEDWNEVENLTEKRPCPEKESISFSPKIKKVGDTKASRPKSKNDNTSSSSEANPDSLGSNGSSIGMASTGLGLASSVAAALAGFGLSAIFGAKKRKNASTESSTESTNLTNSTETKPHVKSEEDINLTQVRSAVYAPSEVNRGDSVIIQVYVYTPIDEGKVAEIASEIDNDATRRNYVPLTSMVKKQDKIKFLFRTYSKSVEVEESSYEGIWNNELLKHEFVAYVPEDFSKSNFLCSVNLLINDIPVGDMKFKINVVDNNPRKLWAEIKSNGYKKSFISYSHADAEKIRFIAEGFRIQGIDYFFDEHSLRTGDNYPKVIDEYISSCDVFVLCWSENAKSSDWVRRECNIALQRYDRDADKIMIYPISILPKAELPNIFREKIHIGKIE